MSTSPTFLFFLMPEPKEQTRIECLSFIVLFCAFVTMIDVACALPGNSSYDDFNGLNTDSLYLSHENLSPREVTDWMDRMSGISSVPSNPDLSFRYEAIFFPDLPPDAELVL